MTGRGSRRRAAARRAVVLLALAVPAGAVASSAPWTLDLAPAATVAGATARLADVAAAPVPGPAADLAVASGGSPGATRVVSGRAILRQLVLAGLADGVRLAGAERCTLRFAGAEVPADSLIARIGAALAARLPAPVTAGTPPARLAISLSESPLATDGPWRVEVADGGPLPAGTSLVPVTVVAGERRHRLTARVTAHVFGPAATATRRLAAGAPVPPDALAWSWRDLADAGADLVADPGELAGMVAAREVTAGGLLRRGDLRAAPLVRAGELVELVVRRGAVTVTVRGTCRHDGRRDDVVSVRNELTGRLVAGRVAGPGLVVAQH